MCILEIMRTEIYRILKIVDRKVVEVITDRADEALAVRIPEVMGVRAHAVRTLFKIHRRLAGHFANVVAVFDVQQHDGLAEISQQRQLAVGRERRIVTRTYAVKMFDVEVAFGPIKAKYSGAANQPVQVWPIQRVVDAKGLVAHLILLPKGRRQSGACVPAVPGRSETWAERIGFIGASNLNSLARPARCSKGQAGSWVSSRRYGPANDNAARAGK